MKATRKLREAIGTLGALGSLLACGARDDSADASNTGAVRTLSLGAYTTPREVYGQRILPAFAAFWKKKTGETVRFEESYLGSGAQARAIIAGFRADIAALSLEPDIERLVQAKLVAPDWKNQVNAGIASRSLVVIAVRPGNPKGIHDWDDLRRPGLAVLTPNPATSGGAMWNISAIFGAAIRGSTSATPNDTAAATRLLAEILRNVTIMDKGARESMLTFEQGVGDAAITYENEVLAARKAGKTMDYVIPKSTLWIETPVAVVRGYADAKGNTAIGDEFVTFLASDDAQRAFAEYGFRPAKQDSSVELAAKLPKVTDTFTIRDLGGWPAMTAAVFAPRAIFERAQARAAGR